MWPITSDLDPAGLGHSLASAPLLAVLRPSGPPQAERQIEAVAGLGFRHVELAWSAEPWWAPFVVFAQAQWPQLRFGAAGIKHPDQIVGLPALGLGFAMAPIATEALLLAARRQGITLVPGVFSPSEVHHFGVSLAGGGLVKLYPAAILGPAYWRLLRGPLQPLPFCIAAGGLAPKDVGPWLEAGVQAVALGSSLFDRHDVIAAPDASVLESFVIGTTHLN
ncbi:MAG: hypothetical protein RLZZ158_1632 [Cyanobacteriota bacterium]|jgi:2-dehydro-3-deoxyphosphogluconate aldolase / (4S)-4-hydroxy-2-oxoglutarate aldolase